MNLRGILRIVVPTLILCVALWWTLHGVDVDVMITIVGDANPLIILAALPVVLCAHVLRARRWQTLLIPTGYPTRFSTAFHAVMIGYAANTIVPRIGEIIRGWVFSRRQNVPLGTAISSVLVERFLDVISLLCALGLVLFFAPVRISSIVPGLTAEMVALRIALPVSLLALLVGLVVFTRLGSEIIDRLIRPLHAVLAGILLRMLTTIRDGMAAIGKPKLYVRLTLETIGIWMMYVLPLWIVTQSLPFAAVGNVSLIDSGIILVVVAIGVTIAPTPGAIGVYQTFAQAAFVAIASATPTEGLAFGILTWLVNYGLAFVVGAISWIVESRNGLSWKNIKPDGAQVL